MSVAIFGRSAAPPGWPAPSTDAKTIAINADFLERIGLPISLRSICVRREAGHHPPRSTNLQPCAIAAKRTVCAFDKSVADWGLPGALCTSVGGSLAQWA